MRERASAVLRIHPLAAGAGLFLAFGAGLFLGHAGGSAPSPRGVTSAPATARRAPPEPARASSRAAGSAHPSPAREDALLHEDAPAGGGSHGPELEIALAAAREAARAPADEARCDQAQEAAEALERALLDDPHARAAALARLRAADDPAELELLAAVLGRVKDLAVEEAALELTRAATPAARAAGYDLLDALDLPSARTASLEGLARAREPQVRRAALNALPAPVGASLEDARDVVTSLAGLVARDPDPELRRRAAIELGRWHRGPEDLEPVLAALERDADPGVRAGAAFGLELAARRDAAVVEALVRVLRRADEDPLVRENAWKALGALGPLEPAAQAEWRRYEARAGALGDG